MPRPSHPIATYDIPQVGVNLQAQLSAASVTAEVYKPHHPITCASDLRYEEDGTLACEHIAVGPNDRRTQYCLDHSIALLMMQLASEDECLSDGSNALSVENIGGLRKTQSA